MYVCKSPVEKQVICWKPSRNTVSHCLLVKGICFGGQAISLHINFQRDFIWVRRNGPDEIWVLVLDNRSETVKVIVIYQYDVAVCLGSLDTADIYWKCSPGMKISVLRRYFFKKDWWKNKKWLIFMIIYLCLFVKVSGRLEPAGIIIHWLNPPRILFLDLHDKVFYDLKHIESNSWICTLVNTGTIIFDSTQLVSHFKICMIVWTNYCCFGNNIEGTAVLKVQ